MPDFNALIAGPSFVATGADEPVVAEVTRAGDVTDATMAFDQDRTEYVVATFVIVALALLILFRIAGFQAVVATSGKLSVGG